MEVIHTLIFINIYLYICSAIMNLYIRAHNIDSYTERDVRLHINRLRDLLGGPYKPNPSAVGIDSGISFLTAVTGEIGKPLLFF